MSTSAAKSAAKARERRSKLLAIGLGVVLLAVAAIQGPKLMKQLSGSKPSASPAPVTVTAAAATEVLARASSPATLARGPLVPAPAAGQLASFSRFAAKDVFHQQIAVGTTGGGSTASGSTPGSTPDAKAATGAGGKPVAQGKPITFAVTPSGSQKSAVPLVPAALLRLNGKRTVVALGDTFPRKHPLFRLISLSARFITIKLIGGSFANGKTTLRIDYGHPLKLANVTDASSYSIGLLRPTTTHPRVAPANRANLNPAK